jgi:ubiquinone/menaquinone biosynthesis C-methylase UbiE
MSALEIRIAKESLTYSEALKQCPRCRTNIDDLNCALCGFQMKWGQGIVRALPPERLAHYAQFMNDYAHIRDAEGRGSEEPEFYLGLPYKDVTGSNSRQWTIRARSYDYLVKRVLKRIAPNRGAKILDLGAGNCWMSYRLALAGHSPVAVDLLDNDRDGLGAASHFQNRLPSLFPRFQAELTRLPFQDGQFDAVIFNASFHYSEDYESTLREALRCVKQDGAVIISDTPWYAREESGRQMVQERHVLFARQHGNASDSIKSLEYLTSERLRALEDQLSIRWTTYSPWYGLQWAMRPLVAKLRQKREPSKFRIYVARKIT